MSRRLLTKDDLREEQRIIVKYMLDHEARMIVSTMGSGKTGATLTALRILLDRFEIRRVLIIAPLRVARDTWPEEIRSWVHTRMLSYSVVVGTEEERLAALKKNAEITIMNWDNLQWLANHYGRASKWPFDAVIVDESSMFKSGKRKTSPTKRVNAQGVTVVNKGGRRTRFSVLATVRKKLNRIYLLTGTPAPRGVVNLWGQIYLIDLGKRLKTSLSEFEKKWFDKDHYAHTIEPKPGAEAEIIDLVRDVMVSIPPRQLVAPPVYITHPVTLPPAAMKEYARFKRTLVSEPHDVEAASAGVLTQKLLQFANGSMYREDRSVAQIHTEKLKALDELVDRAVGENLLILYSFKFDLAAIRERYPDAVVLSEDDSAIARWNRGEIRILLAHPASCAHGLNLQYGGHIQIWFGLTWSLELYQQANARLARPGQQHIVGIYHIVARGTVDEKVLTVLAGREITQDRITKAVAHHLIAA